MGAAFKPTQQRALLGQPWQAWRNQAQWRRTLATLATLASPVLLLGYWQSAHPLTVLGALLSLWLVVGWAAFSQLLLRQNTPRLAHLVPGQARSLVQAFLLWAALFVLALCGALSLWDGWHPAWPLLALGVLVLLGWMGREPWLWVAIWFVIGPLVPALRPITAWLTALPATTGWLLYALAALLALGLLPACMGRGDARHQRAYQRRLRWSAQLEAHSQGRGVAARVQLPWMARLGLLFTWPHRLWWARLVRNPASTPLARLNVQLMRGPAHGTVQLWLLCVALVMMVLVLGGLTRRDTLEHTLTVTAGMWIGLLSLAMGPSMQRAQALCRDRPDQALLVLLPGLPQGAALARALARRWLLQALLAWAFVVLLFLLVAPQISAQRAATAAAFLAACLPIALGDLRRCDRLPARLSAGGFNAWIPVALVAGLVGWWTQIPPALSLGGSVLLCGALGWRRWQALADAGPPLPAGRASER